MAQDASQTKTLLSSLEPFHKPDNFPKDAVHPFATGAPDACNLLQDLINTTDQLSNSLRVYGTSAQWSNTKLISLLRQHTAIEHTSHSSDKNFGHIVESLKTRNGVSYGEKFPLLPASIPDWCIQQLVGWGTSVGMETFRDDSQEGCSNVVLGGKVLVLDFNFVIERTKPSDPKLKVASVKTSNALVQGGSNASTSTLLDVFLADEMKEYCEEMQRSEESRDPQRAAALRRRMVDHLQYLVLLDGLASRNDEGGIRWLTDGEELFPMLNDLAQHEARSIAASLSVQKAPLDVFLLRSHALPLPYLVNPSISFLTHISPSAYLSLLRNATGKTINDAYPLLDVSLEDLKRGLNTLSKGVTTATLYLKQISEANLYPSSMSMPNVTTRPTFPLHPSASDLDHSFPQLDGFSMAVNPPGLTLSSPPDPPQPHAWILDFTEGGKRRGVVMNQSRIKAIELVVNPLGGGNGLNAVTDVLSLGSWIDLLLNPENMISSERYTALYKSPNSRHPPLQLRLTGPEEPGYILERIPVHSIKEVWGILEIVREQCWLNETLLACNWTMEGLDSLEDIPDTTETTEDELQAVLSGTFIPRKIPVNVFLPSGNETDNLFGGTGLDFSAGSKPKIVMTSPNHSPISGLIEFTVAFDERKPCGLSVSIQGVLGLDIKMSDLEEVCRRGGLWGLPGRIWASGHNST